jgi:hypothetical protein
MNPGLAAALASLFPKAALASFFPKKRVENA